MAKVLNTKLVTDVQISKIFSYYFWEGEICSAEEFKLNMKTRENNFDALVKFIKANHPFKVPQIIAMPIMKGSDEFLGWIEENVKPHKT